MYYNHFENPENNSGIITAANVENDTCGKNVMDFIKNINDAGTSKDTVLKLLDTIINQTNSAVYNIIDECRSTGKSLKIVEVKDIKSVFDFQVVEYEELATHEKMSIIWDEQKFKPIKKYAGITLDCLIGNCFVLSFVKCVTNEETTENFLYYDSKSGEAIYMDYFAEIDRYAYSDIIDAVDEYGMKSPEFRHIMERYDVNELTLITNKCDEEGDNSFMYDSYRNYYNHTDAPFERRIIMGNIDFENNRKYEEYCEGILTILYVSYDDNIIIGKSEKNGLFYEFDDFEVENISRKYEPEEMLGKKAYIRYSIYINMDDNVIHTDGDFDKFVVLSNG